MKDTYPFPQPHRTHSFQLPPLMGAVTVVPTIHAASPADAEAAAAYYVSVSRPDMPLDARMGRAIELHRRWDAEALHALRRA